MMDDTPLKTMWDDMMGGHRDPHRIIDRLIRSEEAEIPVYEELARTAPNEPLRRRIEMMAQKEREEIERLRLLHNMYPATQSPTPYTEPEITLSQFRNWPEMAFALRNMELRQCAMLCHLAAITSDPAVAAVVMELASDELHDAMFWNDLILAFGWTWSGSPWQGPSWGPGRGW